MVRASPKVTANGLRELDGFLSVLLSELAAADGWSKEDLVSLARTRNTPNKLEALCLRRNEEARHSGRLRALGRCRDALFHSDGVVCRGDDRHAKTLTLGWPGDGCGERPVALGLGERLPLNPVDLAWICDLYVNIADNLVRHDGNREFSERDCNSTQTSPYA